MDTKGLANGRRLLHLIT